MPSSARVAFDVVLRPRDAHALAALATGVSVPGSRTFRHFVSPAQFSARFGQPDAVVGRVSASLRGLGLLVGRVSANGLVLPVTGSAGQVETALGTRLVQVRLASGRVAMANVSAPRLPAAVAAAIQAVIGLSDLITVPSGPTVRRAAPHASAARPASRISARPVRRSGPALSSARAPASSARASSARAPSLRAAGHGARNCPAAGRIAARYRAWTYPQLARAYALSGLYAGGHAGAGTTIALFELERWPAADIRAFQTCYRTAVPVRVIKVDGGATGKPDVEPTLDIETALALAPQASLVVYSAPLASYGRSTIDEYTQIVDQREAQVLSTSYVLCERDVSQLVPGLIASENTIFQQAAAEGITVFAAAGDSGSEACSRTNPARKELSVNDPASQPFVTSVGGTSLTALGPPPAEHVWNDRSKAHGAGGGGISGVWRMPSWQAGRGVISRYSSGRPCHAPRGYCREVPDVSASADPFRGYLIRFHGAWTPVAGTSAATPLWAAMLADIDSQTSPATYAGFLNPQLYRLPAGTLNDIRTGDNDYTGTHQGRYPAIRGYDMASGLGTPVATALGRALRPPVAFVSRPGTGAPPRRLGHYLMQSFRADPRPLDTFLRGAAGPAGTLAFAPALEHLRVSQGWGTGRNGYTGDAFYTGISGRPLTITVTLPARTTAFYFYGQPDRAATLVVTATLQNGASSGPVSMSADSQARYLGFYGRDGAYLHSITITSGDAFAIGEFGMSRGIGRPRRHEGSARPAARRS